MRILAWLFAFLLFSAAGNAQTALNPNLLGPSQSLSNTNHTVTGVGGSGTTWSTVYANDPAVSGKQYFEVTIAYDSGDGILVGQATPGSPLSSFSGFTT